MSEGIKTLEQKFKNDKSDFGRIMNKDLVCKDCMFRLPDAKIPGNTSRCKKYQVKPSSVFTNYGSQCPRYTAEPKSTNT